MSKKIIYDKFNRVIHESMSDLHITYSYIYKNDFRLTTIESPYNKTNYKTTILEIMVNNNYIKIKQVEYGEKYIIIKKYKEGKRFFLRRFNTSGKSFFIERLIRDKLGKVIFWFEEKNTGKNFGFKISDKLLKNLTLKK